jgi:hypothetical protein
MVKYCMKTVPGVGEGTMNDIEDMIPTYVATARWMDTSEKHPSHHAVADLAYYIYEVRGREDGHDLDDWLRAEQLLANGRRRVAVGLDLHRPGRART